MVGPHTGNAVFVLSAAVDVVVVVAALAWASRGGGARLPMAALAAVAVLAAKGLLLVAAGVSLPFGVLHVIWLDLAVVVPIAGVAALLLWGRRALIFAVPALLMAPLCAYASFVEPERLVVERAEHELPAERAGSRPLRIGVIADLQFEHLGDHEREAVDRLMRERPDLILLAGDYHQGSVESFEEEVAGLRALLRRLRAPGGVYAVQGDVEGAPKFGALVARTGVRPLFNQVARVRVRDRELTLGGVELNHGSAAARRVSGALDTAPGRRDVRILLGHRPDLAMQLHTPSRVDLVVTGHTHGGQVQLPLVGPLTIASRVPRDVGAGGLHDLRGRTIYVSRGVGVERGQAPKLRFGAPPEVAVITLR